MIFNSVLNHIFCSSWDVVCVCAPVPVLLKRRLLIQNHLTRMGPADRPHKDLIKGVAEIAHSSPCCLLLVHTAQLHFPGSTAITYDSVSEFSQWIVQKCLHHFQAWPVETSHRCSSSLFLPIRLESRGHPGQTLHPPEP